jgi:hypothetical protein
MAWVLLQYLPDDQNEQAEAEGLGKIGILRVKNCSQASCYDGQRQHVNGRFWSLTRELIYSVSAANLFYLSGRYVARRELQKPD